MEFESRVRIIQPKRGLVEPEGLLPPWGPSRATHGGPRLSRIRFCAHLGAGVRVFAAAEGGLIGEAAGRGQRFCHGRTVVTRTKVARNAAATLTLPAAKLPSPAPARRHHGVGGRWIPANCYAEGKLAVCWLGPSESAPRATALNTQDYNSQGALRMMEGTLRLKKKKIQTGQLESAFLAVAWWPNFVSV